MAISRKEREEISNRNAQRGWSFSQQELEDLYNRHYNGTEHDKELIEEELEDANWHSAVRHLNKDDYEGLAKEHNAEYGSSWKPKTNKQFRVRQSAMNRPRNKRLASTKAKAGSVH